MTLSARAQLQRSLGRDPRRFTNSLKRAQIYFVRPGHGSTRIQEDASKVDQNLRDAIEAAHKAFVKAYRRSA